MEFAQRITHLAPEGAYHMLTRAQALEARGREIIHLEIGRPDFDTPTRIKEAGKRALDESKVHYSSNYGIPELRKAISEKLEKDNALVYDPTDEIIEGCAVVLQGTVRHPAAIEALGLAPPPAEATEELPASGEEGN